MHYFSLACGGESISLNDGTSIWTTKYEIGPYVEGALDSTDAFELLIVDADKAGVFAKFERLSRLIGNRQKTRRGPRGTITVQFSSDSGDWTAEVYALRLESPDLPDQIQRGSVSASLVILRSPFWRGQGSVVKTASTLDPVFGVGGSRVTNDPETGNFVDLDPSDIEGGVPSPAIIFLRNITGGSKAYRRVYLWVDSFLFPDRRVVHVQGEDESSGRGTDVVNGTMSGGSIWESPPFSTTTLLGEWHVPDEIVSVSDGRWWHLLSNLFHTPGADVSLWVQILDDSSSVVLWTSETIHLDTSNYEGLVNFGPIPLPPGPSLGSTRNSLRLRLYGRAGSSLSISLDVFHFLLTESLRIVDQPSMSVPDDSSIVIDETQELYYLDRGGERVASLAVRGTPILLTPGVEQRLHVLQSLGTTSFSDDEFLVRVSYRPSRILM